MVMKKSQMEVLGLAILFVIIVFGFLIFMMLSSGEDEDPVQDFKDPKMVQSVLDTMVKVSVNCSGQTYSLSDLWKDCVDENLGYIDCTIAPSPSDPLWGGYVPAFDSSVPPYSCSAAEYASLIVLNSTMDEYFRARRYWFKVDIKSTSSTTKLYNSSEANCSNQKAPAYQPITLSRGTMMMSLGVCSR